MKTALLGLALLSLSTLAFAATAPAPAAEDYHGGMHLDIARVISTSDYGYYGIGTRELTYADSHGVVHTLRYQAYGDGCIDQGS